MAKKLIGMYDSGVGGLSVAKAISDVMPGCDMLYLGDTLRVPYGDRPKEDIIDFSRQIIGFMIKQGVDLVAVACNTSSAIAIPVVKNEFQVPIIEMIEMGANAAVRTTSNNKVGIIATNNTIKSGAYERAIKALNPNVKVFVKGCPLLVPLVESGEVSGDRVKGILEEYLIEMKREGIDTLVYGCTHYPFLEEEIINVMGVDIRLVDPALEVAQEAKRLLGLDLMSFEGSARFLVTGEEKEFSNFLEKNETLFNAIRVSGIDHLDVSALTEN